MKKNKLFVTLHPVYNCHKDFVGRDVGQIGLTFMKEKSYISQTWTLLKEGRSDFTYKNQKRLGFTSKYSLYKNLFLKAPSIDVLHMYHIYKWSFLGSILYKIRNNSGVVYIKMDTPLKMKKLDYRDKFGKLPKFLLILFFLLVDYIGFEDQRLLDYFQEKFPEYSKKFIMTTNGGIVELKFINRLKKENSIVLCGRFGSIQKNNELLLKILSYKDIAFLRDWKIYCIGGYTDMFKQSLEQLYEKRPLLRLKIHLLGFIDGKKNIYSIMSKAKIFLHTASREGDPNIQYDAMFCGCYMISTDVANIKQNYPSEFSLFYKIEDSEGLYNTLRKGVLVTNGMSNNDYQMIQNHFIKNFTRRNSLSMLLEKL